MNTDDLPSPEKVLTDDGQCSERNWMADKNTLSRTNWLVHTPELNKIASNFIYLTSAIEIIIIISFIIYMSRHNITFILFATFLLIVIILAMVLVLSIMYQSDKSGWGNYDTMRVTAFPRELAQQLSSDLARLGLKNAIIEKPPETGYVKGAAYKVAFEDDDISLWLTDITLARRPPGLTLVCLGKKSESNGKLIEQYRKIISEALDARGCTLLMIGG